MRLVAPAALAGILFGIGIGLRLWSNVSGVVLAFYGLVLGALFGAVVLAVARRRR